MNTEPLLPHNEDDLGLKKEETKGQSNVPTVKPSQPPADHHVINVGGHQRYEKRPFILDDYLGPYSLPKVSEIEFPRLEPYVRFYVYALDEKLEGTGYKLYQIYLLIICCLHILAVVSYCFSLKEDPVLASVILVVFAHFGCALWQSYHEYKAVEYKDESSSKKAIFFMKTLYVVSTCLLIGAAIGFIISILLLVIYAVLFVLHLFLTLVVAYKVENILTKKRKLTDHLNGFAYLKNDQERYLALFDVLYMLSEKGVLFPIANKYQNRAKDNNKEQAEAAQKFSEVLKTFAEQLPRVG